MSTQEWGNITWKFFHTLAAQIKENKFSEVKNTVIDIIIQTCHNLPCPNCRDHVSNVILKKAYIQNIKTKLHLIEFLRQLHNIVNIKLRKKIFTMEEIKDMYTDVNIYTTVNQFITKYSTPTRVPRLMSHNMYKANFIKTLIPKLNTIKYAFEDLKSLPSV